MSKLPVVSGQEVVKALARVGYEFDHQKGSHIVLRQRVPPHRQASQTIKKQPEEFYDRLFVRPG